MAKVKTTRSNPQSRPSMSPEADENRMIAKAMRLVEQRLDDGTASSQETTHFLKLGTQKAKLEREILAQQAELIKAKTESLQSAKRVEELYDNAINAMRKYGGQGDPDDY